VASLLNQTGTHNAVLENNDIVSNGTATNDFDDIWLHRNDSFGRTQMEDINTPYTVSGIIEPCQYLTCVFSFH
jgi:hypothetical protein